MPAIRSWHDIGKLPESQKAADLLAKRGVIEIRQPQNQYKLTPKGLARGALKSHYFGLILVHQIRLDRFIWPLV